MGDERRADLSPYPTGVAPRLSAHYTFSLGRPGPLGCGRVETSPSDTSHEGLQGYLAVIAVDRDFVCQSRIPSPLMNIYVSPCPSYTVDDTYDDPRVEISPGIGIQGPWVVGLVTRNEDVAESLGKADTRPAGTRAVAEGLPAATKTTTEGTVAVRVIHHWSQVGHNREKIASGGEGRTEEEERNARDKRMRRVWR